VPRDAATAESITTAKRNLLPGETLDTFGGFTFYGQIEKVEKAKKAGALPIGLAPGAVMRSAVMAGEVITWEDVSLDESQVVVKLRREQEKL
jgi:predicted homoserine dehydrogenase-like protein